MNFNNKPIFGMIHLCGSSKEDRITRALKEIDILTNEGVDGIIVENYHGSTSDVEAVLSEIKEYRGYLGINILPNEYEESFKLAGEFNADFIQMDYIAGKYMNTEPIDRVNFMKLSLDFPDVRVLGGVHPKYYTPILGSILKQDVEEAMSLCDGIVVTGERTGKETSLNKIKEFKYIIDKNDFQIPLIVGAGLNANNVIEQLSIADGGIVGSCFKPYNRTNEPIKQELVKEFMDQVKILRQNESSTSVK